MRRRDFIALVGTAVVAGNRDALAQSSSKIYRLAVISPQGQVAESHPNSKFLLAALAQRGYALGQNLAFEGPPGAGQPVRLPELMEQAKPGRWMSSYPGGSRRRSRPRQPAFRRWWPL